MTDGVGSLPVRRAHGCTAARAVTGVEPGAKHTQRKADVCADGDSAGVVVVVFEDQETMLRSRTRRPLEKVVDNKTSSY